MLAKEHQHTDDAVIDTMEIFLQSGELYFGSAPAIISTMLHSRIVVTLWHPGTKIGGMCHITSLQPAGNNTEIQYADSALAEFTKLAHKYSTPIHEYEVRVYIGSRKQAENNNSQKSDADKLKELLDLNDFNVKEFSVAKLGSRKIKMDLSVGSVEVKNIGSAATDKTPPVAKKVITDEFALEIFLHPGDIYFGRAPTIISTLLGSCVAATLWHPKEKIGGMCHVVLPDSPQGKCEMRYGDCAIAEFVKQAAKYKTRTKDYEVHLYGGSDMFPNMKKSTEMKIGNRNIDKVKELLGLYNFHIKEIDTGGNNSRKIKLDLSDGSVWARQTSKPVEG